MDAPPCDDASAMTSTDVETTATTRGSEHPWRGPLILFLASFVVYAVTISHGPLSLDSKSADFAAWHLASHGTPWLDGVSLPMFHHHDNVSVWMIDAPNGHAVIARSPGVVAASLPLYWAAGRGAFSTVPGGLSAALITAGALALLFVTLRRRLTTQRALTCTLAFGFATPVWSVAANGMWPHTLTVFGICGMAWAASTGRWWWVGIFGGITLWGRLHAAVIVAALGVLLGIRRRSPSLIVQIAVVSGSFLLLMCVWTRWMYGTWDPTVSYNAGAYADYAGEHPVTLSNQAGFWVAPDRGILVWTPVILLLLPAVVRSWRTLPDWSRSAIWGGLAYTLLQGVLNRFSGGDAFYGYRLELELLACATPALAFASTQMVPRVQALAGALVGVQLLAISIGSIGDGNMLPGEDAWHKNAFVTFLMDSGPAGFALAALFAAAGAGAVLWAQRRGRDQLTPARAGT